MKSAHTNDLLFSLFICAFLFAIGLKYRISRQYFSYTAYKIDKINQDDQIHNKK